MASTYIGNLVANWATIAGMCPHLPKIQATVDVQMAEILFGAICRDLPRFSREAGDLSRPITTSKAVLPLQRFMHRVLMTLGILRAETISSKWIGEHPKVA